MQGFVVAENRLTKAKKIESVIRHWSGAVPEGARILDIGCGNGEILMYFSGRNNCCGVDVRNQLSKRAAQRIEFFQIDGEKLPFPDSSFDIVLSNHVVEHMSDQQQHLSEVKRVLKDDGLCYFATPNRYFPLEPHHRLPFLHYLPDNLFLQLLRLLKMYREDLHLLGYFGMKALFESYGLKAVDYTAEVIRNPEQYFLESKGFQLLPSFLIRVLSVFSPTCIFVVSK